jgi:hypothetical protein
MRKDRGRWIALAAALPVGLALAFFLVLAPLFTDGPASIADPERLASLAVTVGIFTAVATAVSWASRGDGWALLALGLPGVGLAAWYVLREPGVAELATAYVALVLLALVAGRMLGLRLRGPRWGDHDRDDQRPGA